MKIKRNSTIYKNVSGKFSVFLFLLIISCYMFALMSCRKVIDINLNKAAPKIVINAEISDNAACMVNLIETVNFDESNTFPVISGAKITITDNSGNSDTLTEITPGNYKSFVLFGIPGRTYTLSVTVNSKSYVAVSTMPAPVAIDSISIQKVTTFRNTDNQVNVYFKDPANIDNYYRLIEVYNGVAQSDIHVYSDHLLDGQNISISLNNNANGNNALPFLPNDTVTVMLQSIDKNVYEYLRALNQLGNASSSTSPANPPSNFSNGALGYFNACSVRESSIIIPLGYGENIH